MKSSAWARSLQNFRSQKTVVIAGFYTTARHRASGSRESRPTRTAGRRGHLEGAIAAAGDGDVEVAVVVGPVAGGRVAAGDRQLVGHAEGAGAGQPHVYGVAVPAAVADVVGAVGVGVGDAEGVEETGTRPCSRS